MATSFPTRTLFWKAAFRNSRTNSRRPSPRKAMKRPRDGTKRSGGNRSPRNMKPSEPHLTLRNTATRAATGRPDPFARRQPHAGAPLFPRTPAASRGFPRHIASPVPSRPGRRPACRLRVRSPLRLPAFTNARPSVCQCGWGAFPLLFWAVTKTNKFIYIFNLTYRQYGFMLLAQARRGQSSTIRETRCAT